MRKTAEHQDLILRLFTVLNRKLLFFYTVFDLLIFVTSVSVEPFCLEHLWQYWNHLPKAKLWHKVQSSSLTKSNLSDLTSWKSLREWLHKHLGVFVSEGDNVSWHSICQYHISSQKRWEIVSDELVMNMIAYDSNHSNLSAKIMLLEIY